MKFSYIRISNPKTTLTSKSKKETKSSKIIRPLTLIPPPNKDKPFQLNSWTSHAAGQLVEAEKEGSTDIEVRKALGGTGTD